MLKPNTKTIAPITSPTMSPLATWNVEVFWKFTATGKFTSCGADNGKAGLHGVAKVGSLVNEGGKGGGGKLDVVTAAASGVRGISGNAGGKSAVGDGGDGATANGGNDVVEGAVAYGNGSGWDAVIGAGGDCETANGGNGGVKDSGDGDGNTGTVRGIGVTEDGGGGRPWTSNVSGDGEVGAGGVRNIDGDGEDWNAGAAGCGNGGGMTSTGIVAGEYGVTANMIVFVFRKRWLRVGNWSRNSCRWRSQTKPVWIL